MHPIIYGFLLFHSVAECQQASSADSLEARIDPIFSAYGHKTPGAVIGIIDHGKLVYKKGYGMANVERRFLNTPNKIFNIASVSKQFTAAAVSLLIQQNRLSLEDNIRRYIPDFPEYGSPITIRHLLYHTSGIRDYMVLMWLTGRSFEGPFENREAIKIIQAQKQLEFTPGYRCVYSNSNYVLLAQIVRKVTGMTLNEYAKQSLLHPLGMYSSGYNDKLLSNTGSVAISYQRVDADYRPYKNGHQAIGDGGMHTTLEDIVKWDQAFYDTTSIHQQLLVKGTLENGNPLSYGRGIMTGVHRGLSIHTHPGAFLGYRSEILRFPEKQITIVLLGNSDDINPEEMTRQVADAYLFRKTAKQEIKPKAMSIESVNDYQTLTGIYEVGPNVFIEINRAGNELTGRVSGQPIQKLHWEKTNLFRVGSTDDHLLFDTDSLRAAFQLTVLQGKNTVKAKKLDIVSGEPLNQFSGTYYNTEQNAEYVFSVEDGILWFKVGTNSRVRADVTKKYDAVHFSYLNLEKATIKFDRDALGEIIGFTLGSGRIKLLTFEKK